MKQSNLDAVHQVIVDTVQMWASGLTTDNELCDALHGIHLSFTQYRNDMSGLIDPNTGLRYESPKHKQIKLISKGHEAGDDRNEAHVL